MKTNSYFKDEALNALRGNWGKAVLVTLLFVLVTGVFVGPMAYSSIALRDYMSVRASSVTSLSQMASIMQDPEYLSVIQKANSASSASFLFEVFLLFPLSLGFVNAFRKLLVLGDQDLLGNTVHIAFSQYWHKVWGMFLTYLLIGLWTLLFIIPGIIKAYSYAMTPYILEENPELSASEAIHRSRMMMRGHKFDLFWLQLSFIGWFFLCCLTCGLGFFWLSPYYSTAQAGFYEEVKADYALNGGLY